MIEINYARAPLLFLHCVVLCIQNNQKSKVGFETAVHDRQTDRQTDRQIRPCHSSTNLWTVATRDTGSLIEGIWHENTIQR